MSELGRNLIDGAGVKKPSENIPEFGSEIFEFNSAWDKRLCKECGEMNFRCSKRCKNIQEAKKLARQQYKS